MKETKRESSVKLDKRTPIKSYKDHRIEQRQRTPNEKTWRKINEDFKSQRSLRNSSRNSNRSLSNISLGDLKTITLGRKPNGKLTFKFNPNTIQKKSESKKINIIILFRAKAKYVI